MLQVNAFIKHLAESDRDRFQDTEKTIEERGTEIGIVNEVVGNAVDVPGDAHRIDQSKDEHHPEWHPREKPEHAKEISAVQNAGENRERVPAGIGKDPR